MQLQNSDVLATLKEAEKIMQLVLIIFYIIWQLG